MSVVLEVCVDSYASAAAAKAGGADRLEVCNALTVGGTTPSFGLVEQCVAQLEMPVMMMIRPHDGGFVYDRDDLDTMLSDIKVAKSIGVHGVVFGALTPERRLDRTSCLRLIEAAGSLKTTFHRAFDLVSEPLAVLRELELLGIDRVLTSGQRATALAGAPLIRRLTERAVALSVLAGAGVNAENARQLVELTGVREIHASASVVARGEQAHDEIAFGSQRRITCSDRVRAIKDAIRNLASTT
ncbi:copper homeostasis protein CutC [Allorhodopirellula heiligendammensis]|uniref:PF03932 family protein CutC n=1 Tax=Allorhodopirellula heiligendammensis TaxID=2714739 RepID=A0A5C6BEB6_9BACT|nr:copper homeostasis protein CutC [Allorhodopirellula heiligendammensis]TWU09821.1 Copper homeostasis protein CutC [Allorhodopirellula heiligendammensis]